MFPVLSILSVIIKIALAFFMPKNLLTKYSDFMSLPSIDIQDAINPFAFQKFIKLIHYSIGVMFMP